MSGFEIREQKQTGSSRAKTTNHSGVTRNGIGRHILALYEKTLKASRSGPLFSAFPYPTKITPEAIALFIASHTKPGDIVFDGFAGSGTTGIAALLCGAPTVTMREEAKKLGLNVRWGSRRAILQEVGVLGSFVAQTLCNPPNPQEFRREAERILWDCERDLGWMYQAHDPEGRIGTVRYIIWSEVLECPKCGKSATLWEGCVRRRPAAISSTFSCPHCSGKTGVNETRRLSNTSFDELVDENVVGRIRRPAWVYGANGTVTWSRPIRSTDLAVLARIGNTSLPSSVPFAKVPWGDLHRTGYHQGIDYLHHFYTRRNLIVFAKLWEHANSSPLREALRFWLLSYNASHATMMTRVVAKKNQPDLVVTSCQPGVLYLSGLPVEKNLFEGLKRKLKTIHAAFEATARLERLVEVRQGSCLRSGLPDQSVDYVFTDPPFGGNIPYAEVNFVNEAWLGDFTDSRDEITISRVQGKDADDYEVLMAGAFHELHRILKKNGKATVVFHSSSSEVWNALHRAYTVAGMSVEVASILDKTQGSFKQVTSNGAVKGDPVLLLRKRPAETNNIPRDVLPVLEELFQQARVSHDRAERTPQRLYSRFVNHYLTRQENVPLDADKFYLLIATRSTREHVDVSNK